MSDTAYCDTCGARGRRRRGEAAPPDWFFAELRLEAPEDGYNTVLVWACSEACARNFWSRDPARMDLGTGEISPPNPHFSPPPPGSAPADRSVPNPRRGAWTDREVEPSEE